MPTRTFPKWTDCRSAVNWLRLRIMFCYIVFRSNLAFKRRDISNGHRYSSQFCIGKSLINWVRTFPGCPGLDQWLQVDQQCSAVAGCPIRFKQYIEIEMKALMDSRSLCKVLRGKSAVVAIFVMMAWLSTISPLSSRTGTVCIGLIQA